MILDNDRKWVQWLVRWKLWKVYESFRLVEIKPCRGTRWLFERMFARQTRDDLHHAPCCPANHYHYRRLVFQRCTCGAARQAQMMKQNEELLLLFDSDNV